MVSKLRIIWKQLCAHVLDPKRMEWAPLETEGTPPYARYNHTSTLVVQDGGNDDGDGGYGDSASSAGGGCMVLVVGGCCRATAHRDAFILDLASPVSAGDDDSEDTAARAQLSKPSWRQLRPQNPPPPLVSATASDFGESFLCLYLCSLYIVCARSRKILRNTTQVVATCSFLGGHLMIRARCCWSTPPCGPFVRGRSMPLRVRSSCVLVVAALLMRTPMATQSQQQR